MKKIFPILLSCLLISLKIIGQGSIPTSVTITPDGLSGAINFNNSNTPVGNKALSSISIGINNTALGDSAGSAITTGSGNLFLGRFSGSGFSTRNNRIYLSDGSSSNLSSVKMVIDSIGKVGLGVINPNADLHFVNSLSERKIILYQSPDDVHRFFGFGIDSTSMQFHAPSRSNNYKWFAVDSTGVSKELMQLTGTNKLGIGKKPTGNFMLDIGGHARIDSGLVAAKINHILVGQGVGKLFGNTAVGDSSLNSPYGMPGIWNTAFGHKAGYGLVDLNEQGLRIAKGNVAIGINVMGSDSVRGTYNVAVGALSMEFMKTSYCNIGIGYRALQFSNSTYNTAVGTDALKEHLSGNNNVAIGAKAMYWSTTALDNTAVGTSTMYYNLTGTENTALGHAALTFNIQGSRNTAIGKYALYNNIASNNTAVGYRASQLNTSGIFNVALGQDALYANVIGSNQTGVGYAALKFSIANANTAQGYFSLGANTSGANNTANGYNAGLKNISGSNNSFFGSNADGSLGTLNNATAIGANTLVNASNKVRIGDSNITVIEGQVAWSNPSDRRLKENIIYTNQLGLEFITKLQSVSYNYTSDKNKTRYDGFIAQDIEQVMKELNVPFSGVKKSDDGLYSLAYSDFVIPLVNAVRELKKENELLKNRIAAIEELKAEIENLKASLQNPSTDK